MAPITEAQFLSSVTGLSHDTPAQRSHFYSVIARVARKDEGYAGLRETLEKQLINITPYMLSDLTGFDTDLTDNLLFATGYCIASPKLAKSVDVKTFIERIIKIPKLSRDIYTKAVWNVVNIKDSKVFTLLSPLVVNFIGDALNSDRREEATVLKELLRLIDKTLSITPKPLCDQHSQWLKDVITLTTHKFQQLRDSALQTLQRHVKTIMMMSGCQVARTVSKLLFAKSSADLSEGSTIMVLKKLSENHPKHVLKVWLVLVQMVAKVLNKKLSYSNEMFSIPKCITKHHTDDDTMIALLTHWHDLIDIMSSENPGFLLSKEIKLILSPFFCLNSTSTLVRCSIIKAWWHLTITEHKLNYVNNFNSILEPCLKLCFKDPSCEETVRLGGQILSLLLDNITGYDLPPISPSPLELSDGDDGIDKQESFLQEQFFKYFHLLLKYNKNQEVLIQSIWSRVCDGVKGYPSYNELTDTIIVAMEHLPVPHVTGMIETINNCSTYVRTPVERSSLALRYLSCDMSEDHVFNQLCNFLKLTPNSEANYLRMLWIIAEQFFGDLSKTSKTWNFMCRVWQALAQLAIDHTEQGYDLNEGSISNPDYRTSDLIVKIHPKLTHRDNTVSMSVLQSVCSVWEIFFSLYIEQIAMTTDVQDVLNDVSSRLSKDMLTYPLIYLTKVLVDESPVPKLTLSQSNNPLSSWCHLVQDILSQVYDEQNTSGVSPINLNLCITMLTSTWRLLTPGQVVPYLNLIKEHFVNLTRNDRQYAVSLQTSIQQCFSSLLECIQKHLTFYDNLELHCLEEYLVFGFKHSKKLVRTKTAKFWNSTFGQNDKLANFPEKLWVVLQKEAKRKTLLIPTILADGIVSDELSQLSHPATKDQDDHQLKSVKRSFLSRKRASAGQPNTPDKPRNVGFKSTPKRHIEEASKECIYISSSPKKQKIYTEHQKLKFIEQRLERNVPPMYNSLDLNSQEPLIFNTDSQSQDSSENSIPVKDSENGTAKTTTTAANFSSKLFFLPSTSKPSAISKTVALIPQNSPTPGTDSTDSNNPAEKKVDGDDSQDELFIDPPASPLVPASEGSSSVDPPSSERDLLGISVDKKEQSMVFFEVTNSNNDTLPITPSTKENTAGSSYINSDNEDSSSNEASLSNSETQPSATSDNDESVLASKSSDSGMKTIRKQAERLFYAPPPLSLCSESTDTETTSRETTPMIESKKPFPGPEGPVVLDTPDMNSLPVVYVEESQSDPSPHETEEGSVAEVVAETPPLEIVAPPPKLDTFSECIVEENCSTQQDTPVFEISGIDRRSSKRLLSKRSNSEDKTLTVGGKAFKKIKSSEDFPNVPVNNLIIVNKSAPPNMETQRRSLRIRKSTYKVAEKPTETLAKTKPTIKSPDESTNSQSSESTTKKKRGKRKEKSLQNVDTEVVSIPDSQEMPSILSPDASSKAEVKSNSVDNSTDTSNSDILKNSGEVLSSFSKNKSKKHTPKKDKSPGSRGLITSYLSLSPKLDFVPGTDEDPAAEAAVDITEATVDVSPAKAGSYLSPVALTDDIKPRSRKQLNPKKTVQPPRKSLRLNRKHNSQKTPDDTEKTIVPDSQESAASEVINLYDESQEFVPDSFQPAAATSEKNHSSGNSDCSVLPVLSDDLSIEITSSDKNKVLSSCKSVDSIEPFGQPTIHPTMTSDCDIASSPSPPNAKVDESPQPIICRDSPEPVLAPDDKLIQAHSVKMIPDSQSYEGSPSKSGSLRRTTSISSDLPRVIMDTISEEAGGTSPHTNDSNAMERQLPHSDMKDVGIKTPPKSLDLLLESSPRTPSSILKKMGTPSSRSPSFSNRRVTFGPLPEKHRDPHETTPRRHSSRHQRKQSPHPKIPLKNPKSLNEEPVYPSLVHCTAYAHDIIRQLCSGFTMSIRNLNMSQVSSCNIKTIGDLARLTPSEVEELPLIDPKVIQLRRHLKKYEMSQSPSLALISVFETECAQTTEKQRNQQSAEIEEEDSGEKTVPEESEDLRLSGENKENVPPQGDTTRTSSTDEKEDDASSSLTVFLKDDKLEAKENDNDTVEAELQTEDDEKMLCVSETYSENSSVAIVQGGSDDSEKDCNKFQNVKSSIDLVKDNVIDNEDSNFANDINQDSNDLESSIIQGLVAMNNAVSDESILNKNHNVVQNDNNLALVKSKNEELSAKSGNTQSVAHSSDETWSATETISEPEKTTTSSSSLSSAELFSVGDNKKVEVDEVVSVEVQSSVLRGSCCEAKEEGVTVFNAPLVEYPLTQNQPPFPASSTNFIDINTSEYARGVNQFREKLTNIERNVPEVDQLRELRTLEQILLTSLQLYTTHLINRNRKQDE